MGVPARQRAASPQARGRELARLGKQLWRELGSVKNAAAELMSHNPDVPSIQAFRYAAGLSQDQAAVRYNEVANHQTSLGGTTINAWETWARARGAGSPPTFSSLLILSRAYGRGPLSTAYEDISPSDLVSEAYERLAPEDQLSLKAFTQRSIQADGEVTSRPPTDVPSPVGEQTNFIGPDFNLAVPTVANGSPEICTFSLPSERPGQLLDLTWGTFGYGIERLMRQVKNLGRRLDADIVFGINEAGLVMATFLASAQFGRCAIGYLRCRKSSDTLGFASESFYPTATDRPTIVICDFEVKHADVIGFVCRELRLRYHNPALYFAVFGAMTKSAGLDVTSFDDLTGAEIMRAANLDAIFIAATMSPPGIEPPLELR